MRSCTPDDRHGARQERHNSASCLLVKSGVSCVTSFLRAPVKPRNNYELVTRLPWFELRVASHQVGTLWTKTHSGSASAASSRALAVILYHFVPIFIIIGFAENMSCSPKRGHPICCAPSMYILSRALIRNGLVVGDFMDGAKRGHSTSVSVRAKMLQGLITRQSIWARPTINANTKNCGPICRQGKSVIK